MSNSGPMPWCSITRRICTERKPFPSTVQEIYQHDSRVPTLFVHHDTTVSLLKSLYCRPRKNPNVLVVTSLNEVTLHGTVVRVRPIPPVSFAIPALRNPTMMDTKCTFIVRHQVDVAIVAMPKRGRWRDVVQRTDPIFPAFRKNPPRMC